MPERLRTLLQPLDLAAIFMMAAVGFGLRYDSIVGLLRVDIGFPLNRQPGDRSYRVFFGLGQAF